MGGSFHSDNDNNGGMDECGGGVGVASRVRCARRLRYTRSLIRFECQCQKKEDKKTTRKEVRNRSERTRTTSSGLVSDKMT